VLNNIKNKIIKWIFKELLDDIETKINNMNSNNENTINDINDNIKEQEKVLSAHRKEMTRLHYNFEEAKRAYVSAKELLNSHLEIGVDIHPQSKTSWAVICLDGKPEYLKFVALDNRNIKDIAYFLKQFEGSKNTIDSPFGHKDMINDYILKSNW
jgi:uncharacterized coiled-coil protein SlyX